MRTRFPTIGLSLISLVLVACEGRPSPGGSQPRPAAAVAAKAADGPAAPATGDDRPPQQPGSPGSGAGRWRDTAVYLDGVPVGFLSFGELPIALQPTWVPVKLDAPRRPGTQDPTFRWSKERYYKFTDYLRAIGVEPRAVKELHVSGPRPAEALIVKGKDLASRRADGFLFRFGSMVKGKAIPQVPDDFGNGRTPDKIGSVMIFVKKKPPTLVRNVGYELDGVKVEGVPYLGEPSRGGIRVYLDDKLATIVKRQRLDPEAARDEGGVLSWNLYEVLRSQGVDPSRVVEGWLIHQERRADKLSGADLGALRFALPPQQRSMVVGDAKKPAEVIALHTRPVAASELPTVLPEEE